MGWTGVVVKARLLAVGLRRRRQDWQTEEAKVRGVRKEAILGGAGGVFVVSIWLALSHAQSSNVGSSLGGVSIWPSAVGASSSFSQANSSSATSFSAHDYSVRSLH